MKPQITKELIFAHFSRKTSPLQIKIIESWLAEESSKELYYEWLEEWENMHFQYNPETNRALAAYSSFLESNPQLEEDSEAHDSGSVTSGTGRRIGRIYWIAASVVLFLAVSGWFLHDEVLYKTYKTAYGEVAVYKLSDGSTVKLNTNSALKVPRWGFGTKTREVLLTGEANFSVKHTANHQKFIVKTNKNFEVVVLGTEFTMHARTNYSKVVLTNGKVQLLYEENNSRKEMFMKPGDLVTLSKENHVRLQTTKQARQYSEWEEKRFVFEETSLEEVAYLLQENYGLEVKIKGKALSERMLMGSFRAKNVDELLLSISELLDLDVVRQGNHVQMADK
jgi:transmembrane sensor